MKRTLRNQSSRQKLPLPKPINKIFKKKNRGKKEKIDPDACFAAKMRKPYPLY